MSLLRAFMVSLVLWPAGAMAEEPCRADGDRVSCEREAFDKLMAKVVDARARANALEVRLKAAVADREDVAAALKACAEKPPPEPVVLKPTALRAVGPVILSAIGAAVLTAAVAVDVGASGRVTGAVVGLAAVGIGVVLALP